MGDSALGLKPRLEGARELPIPRPTGWSSSSGGGVGVLGGRGRGISEAMPGRLKERAWRRAENVHTAHYNENNGRAGGRECGGRGAMRSIRDHPMRLEWRQKAGACPAQPFSRPQAWGKAKHQRLAATMGFATTRRGPI